MPLQYRLLRVDLDHQRMETQVFDEQLVRKFIGGSGIASKIIWDETGSTTEPLSPENPLVFMIGPYTGTSVPANSRLTVASLSPLTGIWGEAHAGGSWPDELRRTGFDGIVVKGKAEEPLYLWVNGGEVKLKNAGHLWGKDTRDTDELLRKETESKAVSLCIGPAGERLVKVACLVSGGLKEERAAARCGLGAVMGSKNLKAIVVKGTRKPWVADPQGLQESIKRHYDSKITEYEPRKRGDIYAKFAIDLFHGGKEMIKNFRDARFEGFAEKFAEEVRRGKPLFCRSCRTSCFESGMDGPVRRTMAGAITTLGSGCLVDDMEAIRAAYHLCNQLGIDSKSTGAIIAFAMDCFERGIITKADTGTDLTWGNGEGMLQMVKQIGLREGFGAVLGEGVKKAAECIGKNACEFAMHVKGLEFPNWDPRSSNYRALGEATANIGADPYNSIGPIVKHSSIPELGILERDADLARFRVDGIGEAVAKGQNFGALTNSLGICWLACFMWMPHNQHLEPSSCLEWVNYITNWNMDFDEFMRCGERIFNLQRMINVRRGISRKDDCLPSRFLTEKLPEGANKGHVPPLGRMLGDYYSFRRWNEEGIPTKKKLLELGLKEIVGNLN
jgi:aldehyde:ferredoxin oxidoreductase